MRNVPITVALTPEILDRISGTGVTAGWVSDRLGCSRIAAGRLLESAGARYSNGRYRIIGTAPKTFGDAPACVKSEDTGSTLCTGRDRS